MKDAFLARKGKAREFWLYRGMEPDDHTLGMGFQYWANDNFSLFDFGTFPQQIEGKADNNYRTGVNFFKVLEKEGIPHHMLKDLGDRKMEIMAAKFPGSYDEIKQGETTCYLVPMEIIISKHVTPVASLHGRLRRGEEKPEDYGLKKAPERDETVVLKEPKISISTKIGASDKYQAEMKEPIHVLAGLTDKEFDDAKKLALAAYDAIDRDSERIGLLTVADGKDELIMGPDRQLYVADTGYSWDENRFLYTFPDGGFVDVSKQFARNIYAITGYKGKIDKAKKEFPDDKSKWPAPPPLDFSQLRMMAEANQAVKMVLLEESSAEEFIGRAAGKMREELNKLKDKHGRDETGAEL